jgi:hypothetical protein
MATTLAVICLVVAHSALVVNVLIQAQAVGVVCATAKSMVAMFRALAMTSACMPQTGLAWLEQKVCDNWKKFFAELATV